MKGKASAAGSAGVSPCSFTRPLCQLPLNPFTVLLFCFVSVKLGPQRPCHRMVENDTGERHIQVSCFRPPSLYRLEQNRRSCGKK